MTEIIQSADYVIDIGPGAGIFGGNLIFAGEKADILKQENSLTAGYLNRTLKIDIPAKGDRLIKA